MQERQYPELFRQAEDDLGGRLALIEFIRGQLRPQRKTGPVYDLLARWPFACYLTTNFDNEISDRLAAQAAYFTTLRNRKEDFRIIRDGACELIVKLHSDLAYPDEVILTSRDYQRLSTQTEGAYFRDKLRQIMEMFTVLIVGHSMSDCDLQLVLQIAKETADPRNPIYMIAADYTRGQEIDFREKYNIVVHSYPNPDGCHSALRRLLRSIDRYITPRNARFNVQRIDPAETQAASALLIYRRIQKAAFSGADGRAYLEPLVLKALEETAETGISVEELGRTEPLASLAPATENLSPALRDVVEQLRQRGLIERTRSLVLLTSAGRDSLTDVAAARAAEEDAAFGQFRTTFMTHAPSATQEEVEQGRECFRTAMVDVFRRRGLAIANAIFAGQSVHPEDLSDIFRVVSDAASTFPVGDLRVAFAIAAHQFILNPTAKQKAYLESVSQGYFLYHLLGLDPTCSRIRREIFQRTLWIVDSSVTLPLIAVNCYSYRYARDMFDKLTRLEAHLAATPKLLREASDHYYWAYKNVPKDTYQTNNFISLALVKGSFKQNLFVDGFIRTAADGKLKDFGEYIDLVAPSQGRKGSIDAELGGLGSEIIRLDVLFHESAEAWAGMLDIREKVRQDREDRAILRSELQVDAEAEILFFMKQFREGAESLKKYRDLYDRVYFVSTSHVLDRVDERHAVITWTPEALYRYIASLPDTDPEPDLLQKCMIQSYFHAGVAFIDRERYVRFFGPAIDSANLSFQSEKRALIAESENYATLAEAFDATPDLEKPMFVEQVAWRLAAEATQKLEDERRAREGAVVRAEAAEAQVKQLQAEKSKGWRLKERRRERQELARQRNLQDPNHVRKRKKQAKARRKKK